MSFRETIYGGMERACLYVVVGRPEERSFSGDNSEGSAGKILVE